MKVMACSSGRRHCWRRAVALLIDGCSLSSVVRGEPLLYTLYGGLLYGFGMALIFRADATSGGTEIPAKLLEHLPRIRLSTRCCDGSCALALAASSSDLRPRSTR